jgi:hypothetical protein
MGRCFCVVGNSGTGKTHLSRRLAAQLGLPHVELDVLNHRAGWQEAPLEEFRDQVRRTLDGLQANDGGWVVDGNYRSRVGDLINADTYVWLDYPRSIVMRRVVRRTLGRVVTRRELGTATGNVGARWSTSIPARTLSCGHGPTTRIIDAGTTRRARAIGTPPGYACAARRTRSSCCYILAAATTRKVQRNQAW